MTRPNPRALAFTLATAAALTLGACSSSSQPSEPSSVSSGTAPAGSPGATTTGTAPGDDTAAAGNLAEATIKLDKVVDADSPTALVPRSGTPDLYVAEKAGKVRIVSVNQTRDKQGNVTKSTYRMGSTVLDITNDVANEGERGLIGLAFSSDGRRLYVHYSDRDGNTNIDEYQMSGDKADTKTKRRLLFAEQPFPNHNGGQLTIGPDGYLYIGLGDGGSGGDPLGNAQNTNVVLGKILRIDPEGALGDTPYAVPDGNPFASGGGAPEVWSYGLRNPWRFSFDSATGDLWVADVGQNEWEEVNWVPADPAGTAKGANFGWNLMEGTHSYNDGSPPEQNYVGPLFDYNHEGQNCSVTGGYVYRGKAIPNLDGVYVYGDYCRGEVRGLLRGVGTSVAEKGFGASVRSLTSFGQDNDGELFALSQEGGIFRIVPE
jgi:glucose/arabinose dehydrogenase